MNDLRHCTTYPIISYNPCIGDLIIWSGWLSVWYGFLKETKDKKSCICVFSALPILLVSQDTTYKYIKELDLDYIRNSKNGRFAIFRNSSDLEKPILFV
jgi:hypothetical protein